MKSESKQSTSWGYGSRICAPLRLACPERHRSFSRRRLRANPYNAESPRVHLTKVLLAKPVQLLNAHELKKWRDGLLGKLARATVNRACRCLCAALELARQHDERIQNRQAWEVGLAGLPDAQEARNVILSDDKVREFVSAAYALDDKFGLLTDVLAITGARPSQVVRLTVEDLHDHQVRPKLMMPKSGKGGSKLRASKKAERFSVPVTVQLVVDAGLVPELFRALDPLGPLAILLQRVCDRRAVPVRRNTL